MKKALFSAVLGLSAFSGVFLMTSHGAHAQFATGNGCPSANVFYTNGYSNNYCVPSYPPGYPQVIVGGYGGFNNGGAFGGYAGGPTMIQYNPFSPPVYTSNGAFQPGLVNTGPTYYYPQAPTPAPSQVYYGGGFYNGGYNGGFNNGYNGGYNGGYNNGGYYGGGGYHNGWHG